MTTTALAVAAVKSVDALFWFWYPSFHLPTFFGTKFCLSFILKPFLWRTALKRRLNKYLLVKLILKNHKEHSNKEQKRRHSWINFSEQDRASSFYFQLQIPCTIYAAAFERGTPDQKAMTPTIVPPTPQHRQGKFSSKFSIRKYSNSGDTFSSLVVGRLLFNLFLSFS